MLPRNKIEELLTKVNEAIQPIEESFVAEQTPITQPLLFFCFAPRSGSTLVAQTLASSGEFGYISNFTARFWKAPAIAMALEQTLGLGTKENPPIKPSDFESTFGVTKSVSEPHEFGFFWNDHIPYLSDSHYVPTEQFSSKSSEKLSHHINGIVAQSSQPFFFKNSISGLNVHLLKELCPNAKFILLLRDPLRTAQSLLWGREQVFGNTNEWFSLKPSNCSEIQARNLSAAHEVVCQVNAIYKDIFEGISDIPERCFVMDYEVFCQQTHLEISKLFKFIEWRPENEDWRKKIPAGFAVSDHIKVDKNTYSELRQRIIEEKVSELMQAIRTHVSNATDER
ncbi:MAG: sulfotransferase [Calditrichia bacterium]